MKLERLLGIKLVEGYESQNKELKFDLRSNRKLSDCTENKSIFRNLINLISDLRQWSARGKSFHTTDTGIK